MPPLSLISLINPVDTTVTEGETFSFTAGYDLDDSTQVSISGIPALNLSNFINNSIEIRVTYTWLFQLPNSDKWSSAKRTVIKDSYDFKLTGQDKSYILNDTYSKVAQLTSTGRKLKCQVFIEYRLGNTPYKTIPKTPFVGPLSPGQSEPASNIPETTYATLTVNAKPVVYVQDLFDFDSFETVLGTNNPLSPLLKEAATRVSKSIEFKPEIKQLLAENDLSHLIVLEEYLVLPSTDPAIAKCGPTNVSGATINGVRGVLTRGFALQINNDVFYDTSYTDENRIVILMHELGHALGVTSAYRYWSNFYAQEFPDCTINDNHICAYFIPMYNSVRSYYCDIDFYNSEPLEFLDGNVFKRAQSVYQNLSGRLLRYIPLSPGGGHWDDISRGPCQACNFPPCVGLYYPGISALMNPYFDPSSSNTYLSDLSLALIEDFKCMQRPTNSIYSMSLPFDRSAFVSDEQYNQFIGSQLPLSCDISE